MNGTTKLFALGASAAVLLIADYSPAAPAGLTLGREAAAIVGAPATPGSAAGVARRTTRRVVATEATVATAATASAAAAQPPPPPAAAGPLPVGTVVSALPPGCQSAVVSGVQYYVCSGVFYRPAFQGNNLVYVVSQP